MKNPVRQAWEDFPRQEIRDRHRRRSSAMPFGRDNLRKIQQHNSEGHSYTLAMNQFGDLTVDEYRFFFLGLRFSNETEREGSSFLPPSGVTLPTTVDWRTKGYVTGVKDQGQCGSCWAFSATGSLEGQHFKKSGNLVSLSEQNLVDCSRSYGNNGCQGGLMDMLSSTSETTVVLILRPAILTKREMLTAVSIKQMLAPLVLVSDWQPSFPNFSDDYRAVDATRFMDIQQGSEPALQSAVATVGPISVAIDASHSSFQLYHSGVYDEPQCSSTRLDHGVLAVGYGTYQGQDYWLVKNSWATSWGNQGYIMMSRNKNNQCGIATVASYPLV
ncbi:hypothetical protein OS493_027430 [Desmophyllum pertusum]|uniref:Uncharacterized protein n=1 Tax=Desmophyllum pertusum TaxID=174260 RepID=A0A9X0CJ34_9CNID|nr:hypothetical protein OS493_027430 [Desmophyllum pertusum]